MRARFKPGVVALLFVVGSVALLRGQAEQPPTVTTVPTKKTDPGQDLRAQAAALAGYPRIGGRVEVATVMDRSAAPPSPFTRTQPHSDVVTVQGRLLAFDEHWVGVEIASRSVYLPREKVAYVVQQGSAR